MSAMYTHREQALGQEPVDLLLTNCRMVNVLSGRIEEGQSIAIAGTRVVGIGEGYEAAEVIDLQGAYVYPGLIDAHIHLESSKLTIPEVTRAMSRNGTTTVITDPHEIANVASIEGISYQLDMAAHNQRVTVYFTIPSCVPAIPDAELETFATYMGPNKLKTFFNNQWFVALGEMMNIPGAIYGDPKVLQKLYDSRSIARPIDGHAPLVTGQELNTYIYLGARSDHESTQLAEAQEKLDRGMVIMLREGSTESNLETLLPLVTEYNSTQLMFCSDDLDPLDLEERGHINFALRRAVAFGIDPIRALQMATINVARHFKLHDTGAIFPGGRADLVIAKDLEAFQPISVVRAGRFVFRDGVEQEVGPQTQRYLRSMMNVALPASEALAVKADAPKKVRAIKMTEGQIVTDEVWLMPRFEGGALLPDPEQDLAKVVVFERHKNSGSFGVGFISGLGLKRGAVGSSVAHDSHNIIVAGMDDASIMAVAERIRDLQGGQVAIDGELRAEIPLPIAGLMSEASFEEVVAQEKAFNTFCGETLGIGVQRPAAALSFMALPVIPTLRITDKGMILIEPGQYPKPVGVVE